MFKRKINQWKKQRKKLSTRGKKICRNNTKKKKTFTDWKVVLRWCQHGFDALR